jgi:hypothetical protein
MVCIIREIAEDEPDRRNFLELWLLLPAIKLQEKRSFYQETRCNETQVRYNQTALLTRKERKSSAPD